MNFETKAVRTQTERTQYKEHSTPLFMTSSFTFESAEAMQEGFSGNAPAGTQIYSRYTNPNTQELIDKMCLLEGAETGLVTATGMAAIFNSIVPFLNAGDHVIASQAVFGTTHRILTKILPKWNIAHTYLNPTDIESWESAVQPNTKMLIIETPSNPGLALIDLQKAGDFAKKHGLIFHVDNCFATPYLQQPIKFGADIVVHSATKFIDGQGRSMGGIIVGRADLMADILFFIKATGPAMSPFNAWILSKSLETLAVRMDRHCSNALQLAQYLEKHPIVNKVSYPFLPSHPQFELAKKQMRDGGGIVTFELKGGLEAGRAFLNNLKMLSLTANLGDSRTIATHPASTTHARLSLEERSQVGITDGLIRISAGLEHIDDIIKDVEQAFFNL
jgi:O-succinylhomoserine sulfhydrylase